MHISREDWGRPLGFAFLGALTGVVAAAGTFARLGDVAPLQIGSYCLGVLPIIGTRCGGLDAANYVFPGSVFGIVFGPLLYFCGRLGGVAAVGYAAAAFLANAAATIVCISALHPIDDLLPFDNLVLDAAFAGILAGAAGGALLGVVQKALAAAVRLRPQIAVAAALGVLTPLVIMIGVAGIYAFYILWQSGYAAAVAYSSATDNPMPRIGADMDVPPVPASALTRAGKSRAMRR